MRRISSLGYLFVVGLTLSACSGSEAGPTAPDIVVPDGPKFPKVVPDVVTYDAGDGPGPGCEIYVLLEHEGRVPVTRKSDLPKGIFTLREVHMYATQHTSETFDDFYAYATASGNFQLQDECATSAWSGDGSHTMSTSHSIGAQFFNTGDSETDNAGVLSSYTLTLDAERKDSKFTAVSAKRETKPFVAPQSFGDVFPLEPIVTADSTITVRVYARSMDQIDFYIKAEDAHGDHTITRNVYLRGK